MRPMRYERSVAMPMTEQTEPSSSPTDWRYTMRPMKQLLLAMIAGCAMLTAACTSGNNTDSQTHWLTSCSADSECGQGLACLCGVCSTECEETAACSSTPGASVCVKRTQGPSEQLCEVQIDVSGICLPECIADDDCSTSQACRYNTCVPLEEVDRIDGDSNNTNNTNMDMGTPVDMMSPVDFGLPPSDMGMVPVDMARDMNLALDVGEDCGVMPTCPPNSIVAEEPMSAATGCTQYRCVEIAQRPCGEWMCGTASAYCLVSHGGPPPEENMDSGPDRHCGMLFCEGTFSCECVLEFHGNPEAECALREDGLFEITEYLP